MVYPLIADIGCFSHTLDHVGDNFITPNQFCTQLTKAKRPASVVIDSATYLLTISSPDIDNVAMSLYDIMFQLVIDAHSQWIETFPVQSAMSSATIGKLRLSLARFGLREVIMSDSGSCFFSEEIKAFMGANGIKHTTSVPYCPAANRLAERESGLQRMGCRRKRNLQFRLTTILFVYHNMA